MEMDLELKIYECCAGYEVAVGAMGLWAVFVGVFMWRKYRHRQELICRATAISVPKNDDERLELSDIKQQLSGVAGNIWLIGFTGISSILGAIIMAMLEIMLFFHIGGSP